MSERIYLGPFEDEAVVLRSLLDMVPDDPRSIVWVGEERAIDVPDELAEAYFGARADAPKAKPRKVAKATPPPPAEPAPDVTTPEE